jgi:DNA-binding GntR family transcriptional regulator
VRLGTERANDEQREAILSAIEQLADPTADHDDPFERFHSLGDLFLDAAGNMVLKLVMRGLHTHLLDRIGPPPHVLDVSPPAALRVPPLRLLAGAVRNSDGSAAAEAVHELTVAMRGHIAATLSAAHAAKGGGGET